MFWSLLSIHVVEFRLRILAFTHMLKQELGWFDDQRNNTGKTNKQQKIIFRKLCNRTSIFEKSVRKIFIFGKNALHD